MEAGTATEEKQLVLDLEGVMEKLPHREPMLLVDRVVAFNPKGSLVAELKVTKVHCQGHFPKKPVFPGIHTLEALAQAGGLFIVLRDQITFHDRDIFFTSANGVKWRKPVVPGDSLTLRVWLIGERRSAFKIKGEALVDGQVVATVNELMIMYQ